MALNNKIGGLQMKYRFFLISLVLLSFALAAPAAGQDEFDWMRFAGSEITVLIAEHPVTNGIREVLPQFEEQTGIKVNIEALAENLYFDRMELALRAEEGVADVYFLPMDSTAFTQYSAGLIAPITPYLNDPTMTSPDYDFADFPAGFLAATEYPPDAEEKENYGVPVSFEAYILFYNKDLVDQYLDGQVPGTMDELVAAAREVSEESGGTVAGAVMRGIRSHTVMDTVTGMVYNAWGADEAPLPYNVWFEGDWTAPRLTDERVMTGLSHYAGMMSAGPANIQALDWPDASLLFQQGRAAFLKTRKPRLSRAKQVTRCCLRWKQAASPIPDIGCGGWGFRRTPKIKRRPGILSSG
jgi:multiple sugar transport system substrate-binding protein